MSASRTCPSCDLPFPFQAEYESCPVCTSTTAVLLTTPLPDDWEKRLEQHYEDQLDAAEEADRVIANRLYRLRRAGFAWDVAARLASRFQGPDKVEVPYVEQLLADGATHKQVVGIVS